MAKTDNWQRRKRQDRGFDDFPSFPEPQPSFARRPSPSPISSGPDTTAVVKWFNPDKGFGFVELTEGAGDVFLHASVLTRIGVSSVNPGATLRVRVGQGQKGPQITEVLEVDESTASEAPPPRAPRAGGMGGAPRRGGYDQVPSGPEVSGTVKWYNQAKGFGFIAPEDGGKDVFVHASALRRAGLTELAEGQRVAIQVVQGAKGPEAASVRVD
ncbi:MAG TPA: cold-shock protein [Acetobacteraceae bacterium]|nr:cold-shock protein [Acetobacteraceae bacterium]